MTEAGVTFIREPRTEPYGRVAVFLDIAGNRWDLLGAAGPVTTPEGDSEVPPLEASAVSTNHPGCLSAMRMRPPTAPMYAAPSGPMEIGA